MMRSNAVRSTAQPRITGNAAARHGSITMVSPSLNFFFPLPCPTSHTTQIFKVKFSPPPLMRHSLLGVPHTAVWVGLYFMGCPVHSVPVQPHKTKPCSLECQIKWERKSSPYGSLSLTRMLLACRNNQDRIPNIFSSISKFFNLKC